MDSTTPAAQNPLATQRIETLIPKFAIPAIISGLVSALYNIVDQIFIGQSVGIPGNAATNVAFPLVTICTAIALLLGVGSASNFSLCLGKGDKERAGKIAGTGISLMAIFGVSLFVIVAIFLEPLMRAFGATPDVLPLALTYTGITAIGMPFLILGTGASQLVRADGNPKYAMIGTLTGAVLNTILDPIFIFGFDMGMAGAAWATIIGQIVSCVIILAYFPRFKTIRLTRKHLRPQMHCAGAICALGAAACFNQLAMTVVQIAMNNVLRKYGALSEYGQTIPLACVGVIAKVNVVYISILVGLAQGCQPIMGYNYGARNYNRVRETYKKACIIGTAISVLAFLAFQFLPRQIISIFGNGDALYYRFATRYFRIYMFMVFLNGMQMVTSNFFTAIGKARRGILVSLTRQVLFLLPLILIFPLYFGIDGVMYAGPIADCAAAAVSITLALYEFRRMRALSGPTGADCLQ